MRVKRVFTKAGQSPLDGVSFGGRTSRIQNPDGRVVFENANVVVPENWSQVATDILAQKYFRRRGVNHDAVNSLYNSKYSREWASKLDRPADGVEFENDIRQTAHRIAGCWTAWGEDFHYFTTDKDAQAFYDELLYMIVLQFVAPNSPQWFNTGLFWAYGIDGEAQGHYYVDPLTQALIKSTSAYVRPQPHACFIQSVKDDLVNEGGIFDLFLREARLFKYGSGTGSNFSNLRAADEDLAGGGKSSGLMSWLGVGDKGAGAIKSGGTTRRAAKMVVVNADHPDIERFIEWKMNEERKVAAMAAGSLLLKKTWKDIVEAVEAGVGNIDASNPRTNRALAKALLVAKKNNIPGSFLQQCVARVQQRDTLDDLKTYDLSWEGDAYNTVSGMNANNTVRVTDEFMTAAFNDSDWKLTRRTDGRVTKTLKARALFDRINRAAWMCADPGLQFDTTINDWHTCLNSGRINASNPCSEYMFLDDTACNLASTNLVKFLAPDMQFDVDGFKHASRLTTIALEISVLMAQFPSPEIARLSHEYRTLGLGYANLGSLLMRLGIPYDSELGRNWAAAITAIQTGEAYATSAELASELGPFTGYEKNKEVMLKVIRNHRSAAYNGEHDYVGLHTIPIGLKMIHKGPKPLVKAARECWDRALAFGEKFGYRNAQTTCIAPTGTIGLVMDCDTTGTEPDFALVKYKKLAGGGYMKLANQAVPPALRQLGYSDVQVSDIVAYIVGFQKITDSMPGQINRSTLLAAGWTEQAITAIELKLPASFDPLAEFGRDRLHSKFTAEAVEQFELLLQGTLTIEGAPHLLAEHLPVFDCANKCGRTGKRFIASRAHVEIMAATQPFISGAISKTVNMPAEAAIEEIAAVHKLAWELGLKAVALYRDGSKMSQALATNLDMLDGAEFEQGVLLDEAASQQDKVVALAGLLARSTRKRLPNRCTGLRQKAKIGGHSLYLHTGEYEDGQLGEIFIDVSREGATLRSLLNCFAVAISLGLQYGVPLEEFIDAFCFTKFEPSGFVQGSDYIRSGSSLVDYVFRELAVTYLGRYDLAHVKPEEPVRTATETEQLGTKQAAAPRAQKMFSAVEEARSKGFTGNSCSNCGGMNMVRSGTCEKCNDCGTTTGCS